MQSLIAALKMANLVPTALAHCVGKIRLGALHGMPETDFMECIQANLFSAFYTLAGFTNPLKEAKLTGSAAFVSSAAASIGTPNHEAIAAAKGGLEVLVRSAAATYASANIRINVVAPGLLDTPAAAKILGSDLTREITGKQYPIAGDWQECEYQYDIAPFASTKPMSYHL